MVDFLTPKRKRAPILLIVFSCFIFLLLLADAGRWLARPLPRIFFIVSFAVALAAFYVGVRELRRRQKATRDEQHRES
jgi:protein-S-isoprenylcysteine O-methyltransferase Ste14